MKIIQHYQNGYVDADPENEREKYFEKGDFVEIDYREYQVIDYIQKDGHPRFSLRLK